MQKIDIGTHLVSPRIEFGPKLRNGRLYDHHGLYVGDDTVIHYSGMAKLFTKGPIKETSVEAFAGGQTCDVLDHPQRKYSGEIGRAHV